MSKTASLVCRLICGPAGSMSEGGFWTSGWTVAVEEDDEDWLSGADWAWRVLTPDAKRASARSCGASARRLREDCIDKWSGGQSTEAEEAGSTIMQLACRVHFAQARPSANLPAVISFWTLHCERSMAATS